MDEVVSAAYWKVVRTLTPYQEIQSALVEIEASFCEAVMSNPRRAGGLFADSLAAFAWNWPGWKEYAEQEDFDPVDCRWQMAIHLAARIARAVYAKERYSQLTDPGLLKMRPCWKFQVPEPAMGSENVPDKCKQMDGVVFSAKEAIKAFPYLPCDYLGCRCSIHAVKDGAN